MVKRREKRLLTLAIGIRDNVERFLDQWERAQDKRGFLLNLGDFKHLRYSNFNSYVGILNALDVTDEDSIEVEIFVMEKISRNIADRGNSERHRAGVDYIIERFVNVS